MQRRIRSRQFIYFLLEFSETDRMDVLKPQLLWIGKRCYRVNSNTNDNDNQQQQPATNEYVEDGLYSCNKTGKVFQQN